MVCQVQLLFFSGHEVLARKWEYCTKSPSVVVCPCLTSVPRWKPCKPDPTLIFPPSDQHRLLPCLATHPLELWGMRLVRPVAEEIRQVVPFVSFTTNSSDSVSENSPSVRYAIWFCNFGGALFSSSDLFLWSCHWWRCSGGCSNTVAMKLNARLAPDQNCVVLFCSSTPAPD